MKSKTLLAVVATVLMAAAASYISHVRAPVTDVGTPPLYPDLLARLNDVQRVEIETKAGKSVLVGSKDGWTIESRDHFPARFEDIKRAIVSIGELKIIEPKTKLPEMYTHIGVEDPGAEGSKSTQVTLKDGAGQVIAALLVGKQRAVSTGPIKAARYVRRAGEPQSWLVEGDLQIPADALEWTDRQLLTVPANRINEVRIEHAGKPAVRMSRQKVADIDLTLDGVPSGYKVRSGATVTSLGAVLEDLRFDDVRAASALAWPADSTRTTLRGFDGLVAEINTATIDNRKYSRLSFRFDPAGVTPEAANIPKEEQIPELPMPGSDSRQTAGAEKKVSVEDEVKALNARVEGWAFVLPDYKQQMLTRTLDDLVQKQEVAKEAPMPPPQDPLTVEHFDAEGNPIPGPAPGAPPADLLAPPPAAPQQ